jgi:hypothetical protein
MAGEKIKNRVRQTCTGTGTGDLGILAGTAEVGHVKVSAAFAALDVGIFALESGADYEIFYGTVSADSQTLARTTVIESTNSGSRIVLDPAQTHKVMSVLPEQLAPYLDAASKFAKQAIRNGMMEAIQCATTAGLPAGPLTNQVVVKLGDVTANDGQGGVFYYNGSAWTRLVAPAAAPAASAVSYDNSGSSLTATDVQDAIDELATESLNAGDIGSTVQAYDANLDSINQDLGTTDSPQFNSVTINSPVAGGKALHDFSTSGLSESQNVNAAATKVLMSYSDINTPAEGQVFEIIVTASDGGHCMIIYVTTDSNSFSKVNASINFGNWTLVTIALANSDADVQLTNGEAGAITIDIQYRRIK